MPIPAPECVNVFTSAFKESHKTGQERSRSAVHVDKKERIQKFVRGKKKRKKKDRTEISEDGKIKLRFGK